VEENVRTDHQRTGKAGSSFVYLNGDIPAHERNDIIERFRKEKDLRIFLSTDAGGVGVNLQSANILINVDLPWNPAVLEQRIGRIYRLGQKKQINVFNFISTGSIEHRILYLLDFKKSVFSGAIDEEGNDTVMLEGFLKSVRSLTEVQLDSPVVKGTATDDKLRYNAELNVSGNDRPETEPNRLLHPDQVSRSLRILLRTAQAFSNTRPLQILKGRKNIIRASKKIVVREKRRLIIWFTNQNMNTKSRTGKVFLQK
jgi:superfamily II DNA/RNA helicase